MKSLAGVAVVLVVLLAGSTVMGDWTYVAPAPTVVHAYYPPGPVYACPAPMVASPAHVVYRVPYMVYRAPVVVPTTVWYPPPVVVYPKVFIPGQPVRNVLRAVLP